MGAGWTADSWDEGDWLDEESGDYGGCGSWDELTEAARADAAQLGYDSLEWDLCHFEPEDVGEVGEVGASVSSVSLGGCCSAPSSKICMAVNKYIINRFKG